MLTAKDYIKTTKHINKGNFYVAEMYKVTSWGTVADTFEGIMVFFHDLTKRGLTDIVVGHNGTFFTISGNKETFDHKATDDYNTHQRQMRTIGSL